MSFCSPVVPSSPVCLLLLRPPLLCLVLQPLRIRPVIDSLDLSDKLLPVAILRGQHVFWACFWRVSAASGTVPRRDDGQSIMTRSPHLVVWIRCAVALVEPPVFPGVAPWQRPDRRSPCHRACHATARGMPARQFLSVFGRR